MKLGFHGYARKGLIGIVKASYRVAIYCSFLLCVLQICSCKLQLFLVQYRTASKKVLKEDAWYTHCRFLLWKKSKHLFFKTAPVPYTDRVSALLCFFQSCISPARKLLFMLACILQAFETVVSSPLQH